MIGQKLYGASNNLYGGSSYGREVPNEKCKRVRLFEVTGETSRSWILDGRHKVSKKHMTYHTTSFEIAFFKTYAEAVASL